ncbi:MAG: AMP-binding protein, partial [Mycobacterium sp.]
MSLFTDLTAKALDKAKQYAERGSAELHYLQKMIAAGAFGLEPPQNFAALGADILRWGEVGMIPALNARRNPTRTAIIDDEGSMTFAELNDAVNATANGLLAMGVKGGDGVAILARNHRWFLVANYACGRVGARTILLNTEFSGPQIRDVAAREGGKVIIYDDEYAEAVKLADAPLGKLRALSTNPDTDEASGSTDETLAELIARSSKADAPKATKKSSIIILTSGTTGTPKGANRHAPPTLAPIGGVLSHVPFKSGEVTALPSPMFHALGYLHATIAMTLGSTLILHRRFKPATVLTDVAQHQVTAIVVVPVMLSRMLDALEKMESKPDLSSLRIIFVSGSQLGAELASRTMKDIGPVVYNMYGSTEIAFATIAEPKHLKHNPSTAGPV